MTTDDDDKPKSHHHHHPHPTPPYGTFQGVPTYPPPHPPTTSIGFPHPVPPPGAIADPSAPPPPDYYSRGYQAVPGYAVDGRPVNEHRLPCCGLGFGWFLFILGFFTLAIPWYIGVVLLICTRHRMDYREKPGYVACTIAAVLATIAIIFGATKGAEA